MSAMNNPPEIQRVLIANRGEIACRIAHTLRETGRESVAIVHASEGQPRHASIADRSVQLEGASPVAAYLDIEQIVEIAVREKADAIHPGYGFLSENAAFARAVEKAGLVYIGPTSQSIDLMGDKINARAFAVAHGVPVLPSVAIGEDLDTSLEALMNMSFPLLIKAAAGGGGKGMSIVHSAETLPEAVARARGEAERYFSDSRIYAERYIAKPRHIEVQVMGDGRGGAVHLFERECSLQRRFQKIIEEAPAYGLPESTRQAMCEAALRLTRAAKYRNLGTVEFILSPDGEFYFLEMNTRLQVEHPVTEAVTGLDLVQLQLDIAETNTLPLDQSQIRCDGHALECRVCAEDPSSGFTPETGRVLHWQPPSNVRCDHGLLAGQRVSSDFDSLLAKVISHGETRLACIDKAIESLAQFYLLGVGHNGVYLSQLLQHPQFRAGELHTHFLSQNEEALLALAMPATSRDAMAIAALLQDGAFKALLEATPRPYAQMGHWRN